MLALVPRRFCQMVNFRQISDGFQVKRGLCRYCCLNIRQNRPSDEIERPIEMQSRNISDIHVYPHYPGIATEVAPVVYNGIGTLSTGQIMGQEVHQLAISDGEMSGTIQVGATYSWMGRDHDGTHTTSHWLYCTSLSPKPTFGAICDWSRNGAVFPLLTEIDSELIYLEELSDFSAVLPAQNLAYGESQARLGKKGWLVMTTTTAPGFLGVLIENPTLPLTYAIGTKDISISATSARTLQSVGLVGLYCARVGDAALFLQSSVS